MVGSTQYDISEIKTTFPAPFVAHVELDRPQKYNAFSPAVFHNLATVFDRLSGDSAVRCVLLSGVGKHFSAGLDVAPLPTAYITFVPSTDAFKVQEASNSGPVSQPDPKDDVARRAWKIKKHCEAYQNGINAIERCQKPVIVLCHGVVYGAAIDLCLAADIRHCSQDVRFSIKEIDIGIAPDVGTLSRLPKIGVSYSWAKEVIYTARIFGAEEAERVGFVSKITASKDQLVKEALELASLIATKSPVAVQGSKVLFDYSRDRSVKDSLDYTAVWASVMVQTEDLTKAMMSGLNKTASPKFSKL